MKKLVVIIAALGLAFGASAQSSKSGPVRGPRPAKKVVIVRSYPPFNPYFGFRGGFYGYSPFYGYPPFGNRFDNGYRYQNRPTKLDLQVEDIKNDYQDRILSVRLDDDLSRKEKRYKVKDLKNERDRAINDAKKNYYKTDPREKADV
jgi:hypothetical protein